MDASQLVLTLIKDPKIKPNLNPLIYYALKLIYNPEFSKRTKYFGRAIKKLFEELGNNLNIQLITFEQKLNMENTIIFDMTINNEEIINPNLENKNKDDLNISVNKDSYVSINKLMKSNWKWCFDHLSHYDDEYILDKDEDYISLKLIKDYIFGNETPENSTLLLCYNIFISSIELLFCFKLIMSFPKYCFQKKEEKYMNSYFHFIKERVELFFDEWCSQYPEKYKNNILIREIIGPKEIKKKEYKNEGTLSQFTMNEPILNNKYISFTKLIKEGPFCYEIEEIARQICIIDHSMLSSLNYNDFTQYIIKKESPKSFEQFLVREKQFQCYILFFIIMHNNLENKIIMVQNFISLAHSLKIFNNQQTCNTIISAFNLVNLTKKNLLWKLIEKKYRDIYSNLEKELNDIELIDNPMLKERKDEGCVPHIRYIKNLMNDILIQMKDSGEENNICNEYKNFIISMNNNAKQKYSFFKLNPLYDFFQFGFLEIFKAKKWNLKPKLDFAPFLETLDKLDQLLNYLIKSFQSVDV